MVCGWGKNKSTRGGRSKGTLCDWKSKVDELRVKGSGDRVRGSERNKKGGF